MKKLIIAFIAFTICVRLSAQIPAGYYDAAAGLSGLPLKTALYNIIKVENPITYDQLWTAYETTDKKADNTVWDMYSDIPGSTPPYTFAFVTDQCGPYSAEGNCFNREHSFPSSWFADADPMHTDLFHIYPTDGWVNNKRGNFPYGDVGTVSWKSLNGSKLGTCSDAGYTGTVFEPIDEYKGDFARSYFYMATRYENLIAAWYSNSPEANAILSNNSGTVFETWYINVMLTWNNNDTVSQKERDRNNAVYAIQNNRNPYIDNPEWIQAIWGPEAGIKTSDASVRFNVYPIPANDAITIISNKANDIIQKVDVYSTSSLLIHSYQNCGSKTTINLTDYVAGIYFARIYTNNEVIQKKIIVVK